LLSGAGDHPSDEELSPGAPDGGQTGRHLNNMANARKDRVPDPTLERATVPGPEGPAVNGRGGAPRSVVLSLRLRTQDSRGTQADVSWAADSPDAALANDVISASGGATEPLQGAVLVARFFNLSSALLAARRLQWSLQGLGESAGSLSTAASMAVHSMEDQAGPAAVSLLDHVAPGQVLVSSRIADAIEQLPGATLRASVDGNWRELQWRGVETPSGYSADEQSVLGLIRALGREDPCAAPVEAARPTFGTQAAPAAEAPEGLGRTRLEPEPESAFAKRKWLIIGGAAAAVALAVALVAIVSGGHSKTTAQNPDAAAKAPPPATSVAPLAAPPASSPVAEQPQTPKPPAKPGRQPKTEAKAEPPVVLKPPSGPCSLTEAEIPRSLSRAESYMYAGKLADAEAMYQRVLGCPSAHEKAVEGLQRVHQRMAAQSP
jgi:hypothetical protein